jgi:putative colanic acid biosynthesis UDP-glucose lipid carrier transferase
MVFNQGGLLHQYSRFILQVQLMLDGAVVASLIFFSCWLYGIPFNSLYYYFTGISFILTLAVFQLADLYRPWRGMEFTRLIRRVLLAWVIVVAILAFLGFAFKTSGQLSRGVILLWAVLSPLALLLLRLIVYSALSWGRARNMNTRTVVIAGAGALGQRLAANIGDNPWMGLRLLGFFDDHRVGEHIKIGPDDKTFPVVADLDDMVEFVNHRHVDMVYLALPLRAEQRLKEVVHNLQNTTTSVYFVPDVFTFSLLRASISDLRGIPLISLWETPIFGVNGGLKRLLDILLSGLILLLFTPLTLLIALGVKLSSPGPIIFKQQRYGLDGHEFTIYKFRTMTVCEDGPDLTSVERCDPRVTPFGAFLRRTSLDEFPQFINVMQGTMSIVGPRPHAIAHNEFYRNRIPGYMLRHKIRPGLTGWAQIKGFRGETDDLSKMSKRIEFDLNYLENWSLWLDLKIILRTALLMFGDPRAY